MRHRFGRPLARLCTLAVLLGFVAPLHADTTPMAPTPWSGETPVPGAATEVTLDEETVRLWVEPQRTSVEAVFFFRNPGPAVRLQMGFPGHARFTDFRAWVDGETARPRLVTLPKIPEGAQNLEARRYARWFVWTVRFGAGARVTVKVTYRTPPESRRFAFNWPDGSASESACWNNPEEGALHDRMKEYWTGYVLRTGAAWRGPIRKARVEVRLKGLDLETLRSVLPDGAKKVDGGLVWEFRDFEPDEDIFVTYNPVLTLDEEIEAFEKISRPEISRGVHEYFWRPFHLISLYRKKGGNEERIEELYGEIIDRFWPRREIRKPLELGQKQFTALVVSLDELFRSFVRRGKTEEAGALARRVLPFLDIVAEGGAVFTSRGRRISFWEPHEKLPVRASKLAALCRDFLGGRLPGEEERVALDAEEAKAAAALRDPADDAALAWQIFAKTRPSGAVRVARHVLGTVADAEPSNGNGSAVPGLLERIRGIGTREAAALLARYMEMPDYRFDFPRRAATFHKLLGGMPAEFSDAIGPAAVRKLKLVIRKGRTSWDYVNGYASLVGRFGGSEGRVFLKEIFERKHGGTAQLIDAAFSALCETGGRDLIDYFTTTSSGLRFVFSVHFRARRLLELDSAHAVTKMQELLRTADNQRVRETCASVLGMSGRTELISFFEEIYGSENPGMRKAALSGLGHAREMKGDDFYPRAKTLLRKALDDPDAEIRTKACYAFASNPKLIDLPLAEEIERRLETETDRNVRRAALYAVREAGRLLEKKKE
jgi:hypothetical protein